jgi:CheY-like chemotaxis protein
MANGRGETVLLGDHHTYIREIMASMLQSLGYTVLQAGDTPSALDLFESRRADIGAVAVDAELPGGGGPACIARLRDQNPDLPCVLMSPSHEQPANTGDARTYILLKPFQMNQLADAIAASLSAARIG